LENFHFHGEKESRLMTTIPSLSEQQLLAICDVLAEASKGLTGSEISRLLSRCRIDEPQQGITNRDNLYQALSQRQSQDGYANNVLNFIHMAMNPNRYVQKQPLFDFRRETLNRVLSLIGYTIGKDSNLRETTASRNLNGAEQRAEALRIELRRRNVHPDVLRLCQAEFLQEDYFHAVREASKSVAEKIRNKTGLTGDGAKLVDQAFGLQSGPKLAFNTLLSEGELSEHTGLMNLMKGMFRLFRTPTAHAPKISWAMKEQDALDLLTIVSLMHRRLDEAVPTGK
jgi:uncharacterized protein (TIGR02391 family)